MLADEKLKGTLYTLKHTILTWLQYRGLSNKLKLAGNAATSLLNDI